MKLSVNINHTRDGLIEGRILGLGFGFGILKGDCVESVMPVSPCKDYLNDVVFVETRKKEIEETYGFRHSFCGLFENNKPVIIGVVYGGSNNLLENSEQKQVFVNHFENSILGNGHKSEIHILDHKTMVIFPDSEWLREPYAISLFSLIVRCSCVYDGSADPENFVNDIKFGRMNASAQEDYMSLRPVLKSEIISVIREKGIVEQIHDPSYSRNIHNTGIKGVCNNPKLLKL